MTEPRQAATTFEKAAERARLHNDAWGAAEHVDDVWDFLPTVPFLDGEPVQLQLLSM